MEGKFLLILKFTCRNNDHAETGVNKIFCFQVPQIFLPCSAMYVFTDFFSTNKHTDTIIYLQCYVPSLTDYLCPKDYYEYEQKWESVRTIPNIAKIISNKRLFKNEQNFITKCFKKKSSSCFVGLNFINQKPFSF